MCSKIFRSTKQEAPVSVGIMGSSSKQNRPSRCVGHVMNSAFLKVSAYQSVFFCVSIFCSLSELELIASAVYSLQTFPVIPDTESNSQFPCSHLVLPFPSNAPFILTVSKLIWGSISCRTVVCLLDYPKNQILSSFDTKHRSFPSMNKVRMYLFISGRKHMEVMIVSSI